MPQTVNQTAAALLQLEWAIRLLLDYNAAIPAITLAGAADEILGKQLGEIGSAHELLLNEFSSSSGLSRSDVSSNHLNRARNWLKHHRNSNPNANFDLEREATQMITRCLINTTKLQLTLTNEHLRFVKWARLNFIK